MMKPKISTTIDPGPSPDRFSLNHPTSEDWKEMKNKVYIGNLPWQTTTEDLAAFLRGMAYAFHSARVIEDRETGKSRGFAFVEFETPEGAGQAIESLNDYVLDGRPLRVSEARERTDRGGGGRSGGFHDAGRDSRSEGPPVGGGGHDRRGRRGLDDFDGQGDW
jgi:cold-inducible RNA-binding protein